MKINPKKSKSALIFAQLVLDYFNTYGILPTSETQLSGIPEDLQLCASNDLEFLHSLIESNPKANVRNLLEDTVRAMVHILHEFESHQALEHDSFESELDALIQSATHIANSSTNH